MHFFTATFSIGQTASQQQGKRAAAIAFEEQGNVTEAETAWREVLSVRPSDAEACAHLGLLEARQEHYKEAIAFYRKAIAANPAMPGWLSISITVRWILIAVLPCRWKRTAFCE